MSDSLCLIGFGEVGQTLAADLQRAGVVQISAWDLLFAKPDSLPSRALRGATVRAACSGPDAAAGAAVVISAVTAAECVAAARSVAAALVPGSFYVDVNSVSPGTRREAAALIGAAGGRYIEAAVMSPIAPRGVASPMLLGGPEAAAFLPVARRLGFARAELYSEVTGRASAAKLCRSVMIKGIEALLVESLLAARYYGVEDVVLESLHDLLPIGDWRRLSGYMIGRSLQHGARRAAEMREAAQTIRQAGIEPWMSRACVERQVWAATRAGARAASAASAVPPVPHLPASAPRPESAPPVAAVTSAPAPLAELLDAMLVPVPPQPQHEPEPEHVGH